MAAWGDFHSVPGFGHWQKNLSKIIATYPRAQLVIPKWRVFLFSEEYLGESSLQIPLINSGLGITVLFR